MSPPVEQGRLADEDVGRSPQDVPVRLDEHRVPVARAADESVEEVVEEGLLAPVVAEHGVAQEVVPPLPRHVDRVEHRPEPAPAEVARVEQ